MAAMARGRRTSPARRLRPVLLAGLLGAVLFVAGSRSSGPPRLPRAEPGALLDVLQADSFGDGRFRDLAVGPDGTLYVSLRAPDGEGSLLAVPPRGKHRVLLDHGVLGPVALAQVGTFYVVDLQHRVLALTPGRPPRPVASLTPAAGAPETGPGLEEARFLAFDPRSGALYGAGATKIDRVDAGGAVTTVAGARRSGRDAPPLPASGPDLVDGTPAGEVRFDSIEGLAVDPGSGLLYVLDRGALLRIDPHGSATAVGRDAAGRPRYLEGAGLAFDPPTGDLYVLDGETDALARVGQDGSVTVVPGTQGLLTGAEELATDAEGNLFLRTGATIRMLGAPAG